MQEKVTEKEEKKIPADSIPLSRLETVSTWKAP